MALSATKKHYQSLTKRERVAVWITDRIGTFECAVLFAGIGIGSLIGVITGNAILALACGAFSSYFLQLVLLPLLMISQNLQQRHAELVADETFQATIKDEVNTEAIITKIDEIIKILEIQKKGKR